jgi:23S rRNA pseudouridine2605 synthase
MERLQKLISKAGITSRRAAEELILNGRVTVNGIVVIELGSKADPAVDRIAVDGKPLQFSAKHMYILLNKPTGYITALKDSQGRPLVTDLLKGVEERVYPVGRLDYNTEGLLLLTNDGDWANRLMHPRHEVEKEYHVRVRGKVLDQQLKRMAGGVELEEGITAPAVVRMVKSSDQNDWISVTIHEGRNRQVRRMCEVVSLSVVRLRRVRYGSLEIGALKPGQFRYLTEAEVKGLLQPGQASQPESQKVQKPQKPRSTAKTGMAATGRPPALTHEKQTKKQPTRTKPGESPQSRRR